MRIALILSVFLLCGLPAWALNPPVGWTSTGEHTAVFDPRYPGHGELHEYLVGGGSGDKDELEFILIGAGLAPTAIQDNGTGAIELLFDEQRARARFRPDPEKPAWLILFMDLDAESSLDADAVLLSMLPLPGGIGGGFELPTPLDAGRDGDPWGSDTSADANQDSGWWSSRDAQVGWNQDDKAVGKWEGTAMKRGQPTRLKLRLEADGVLVLELRVDDRVEVHEGAWSTREGTLRLDLGESGDSTSNYDIVGTTLKIRYEGVAFDLVQQR